MKRMFPTLAAWPKEKWLAAPAIVIIGFGFVAATARMVIEAL